MNHLLITFADGKQFAIPVRTLAALIAKYFAGHKRSGATYEEAYDAEFNYYPVSYTHLTLPTILLV